MKLMVGEGGLFKKNNNIEFGDLMNCIGTLRVCMKRGV